MLRCAHTAIAFALIGSVGVALAGPCDGIQPDVRLPIPQGAFGELGNSLAAQGSFVAIGDPKHAPSSTTQGTGAVVVYRRTGAAWETDAIIEPPPGSAVIRPSLEFGMSVALCNDWLVALGMGRLFMYQRTEAQGRASWVLRVNDPIPDQWPNCWVASDNQRVIVSTFTQTWIMESRVIARTGAVLWSTVAHFDFGASGTTSPVAIGGDVAVVGRSQCVGRITYNGSISILRRDPTEGWVLETTLPSGLDNGQGMCFGDCVATDGVRIVAGAGSDFDSPGVGYVQVFARSPQTGTWEREALLTHPAPQQGDWVSAFGGGVDIRGDMMVIGSPLDDAIAHDSGAVYSYRNISGAWQAVGSLVRANADVDTFGFQVRLTSDSLVATGSGLTGPQAGVVYSLCAAGLGGGPTSAKCWPGIVGLFHYIELFYAGSMEADMNADARVTVGDLFEFLAAWSAGCVGR